MYHLGSPMPPGIEGQQCASQSSRNTGKSLPSAADGKAEPGFRSCLLVDDAPDCSSRPSAVCAAQSFLSEAAKEVVSYLDLHPELVIMPLGQAVRKLLDGVGSLAEGDRLDADTRTLAKRLDHFVRNHPRLAESEFGQLVCALVRSMLVADGTTPAGETSVVEQAAAETAAAPDGSMMPADHTAGLPNARLAA